MSISINKRGSSKVLFLALVGAVIVCVAFFIILFRVDDGSSVVEEGNDTEAINEDEIASEWITYTNDVYGFSIEHPANWDVTVTERDAFSTMINIYPPGSDTDLLPYTHHSDTVTHVSIYPKGIPTEGFFGESRESEVDFAVSYDRATDYLLENGTPFATIAFLAADRENWTQWGFLFAHIAPDNLVTTCFRGEEELGPYECDPLMGDTLIRTGTVSSELRATEERILESFRFTN